MSTMTTQWSKQQTTIFDWFAKGGGNLVVRARAGTGKTSTILSAVCKAPESDILVSSFGKNIIKELENRNKSRAEVRNVHSLGYGCVRKRFGDDVSVEAKQGFNIAYDTIMNEPLPAQATPYEQMEGLPKSTGPAGRIVAEAVSYAKNTRPFVDTLEEMLEIIDAREECILSREDQEDGWTPERIGRYALRVLERTKTSVCPGATIDFDDQLWLPIVLGLTYERYDLIVIDEAQDLNPVMLELIVRMRTKGGRIVVVGDDRQACYGFHGADTDALDRMKRELFAIELPLTVTYRCAQSIVDCAKALVDDLEARLGAPPGLIRTTTIESARKEYGLDDFVLSRTNAALAKELLLTARSGKPVRTLGTSGDMAAPLVAIVGKISSRTTSLDAFIDDSAEWIAETKREAAGTTSKSAKKRILQMVDKAETVRFFAQGMVIENRRFNTKDLKARIETTFDSKKGIGEATSFSTIHRVKGLEARRVFILSETLYIYGKVFDQEERNLEYIAITRAKEELVWVGPKPAQRVYFGDEDDEA